MSIAASTFHPEDVAGVEPLWQPFDGFPVPSMTVKFPAATPNWLSKVARSAAAVG
jgi:hypothetical protein